MVLRSTILSLALLLTCSSSRAQVVLVDDLLEGPDGAQPQWLGTVGDLAFMAVYMPETGSELWVTDGTAEGTQMVLEIAPGEDSPQFRSATPLGNGIVFGADDFQTGVEPWYSDGTEEGTYRLAELNAGAVPSNPAFFTVLGEDEVFFFGGDEVSGAELWATDGTSAGTPLIANIHPTESSFPSFFFELGGDLYFAADDGAHGRELWRYEGPFAAAAVPVMGDDLIDIGNGTGVVIQFEGVTGKQSPGSVRVERYADGVTNAQNLELAVPDHWVIDAIDGLTFGEQTQIRFRVDGIANPDEVVVHRRDRPGAGAFTPLPTSVENGEIIATGFTSFGQFVLAGESGPVASEDELPRPRFELTGAHPNPFRTGARISLSVARAQRVTVEVYDITGRRVSILHDGPLVPGTPHDFHVDGRDLPASLYVVVASGEEFRASRTLVHVP